MKYINEAKICDEQTKGLRDICARRASTISYMIDEAVKCGLDDTFARNAIYHYGEDIGEEMLKNTSDPTDMIEFAKKFGTGHHVNIYEMERVVENEIKLYIDFHYCPYVEEWIKQGRTPEEMDKLCVIAMEGDRAIGEKFSAFKFTLGKTIAKGNDVCQIRFDKK